MRRRLPALLLLAVASLAGCQSSPDDVRFNAVRANLTPEMQTLDESNADVKRNLAVNFNQDLRMFWMDVGRTLYTDRPSYLRPMPVVATGGQAR